MSKTSAYSAMPVWLKVSAYFFVLIAAAFIASSFTILDSIFFYFFIALSITYVMLRREGKPLRSLGFIPANALDWKHFFIGLMVGLLALSITAMLTIWLTHGRLKFTGHVDPVYIIVLILIHLWSSFVQEFTYRGYPFQSLLKAYGPWIAQISVTLPFAFMHLKLNTSVTFSEFLMTWLTTGLGSVLYGLCYIKTGKLLLSIGLHMGWNLAQALIPRSIEEGKSALFTIADQEQSYYVVKLLLPYLTITLLMIIIVSFIKIKPTMHSTTR